MENKKISNRLLLSPVKSLGYNRLYKGLGLKVKELGDINNINRINKSEAIYSRVNKGSK